MRILFIGDIFGSPGRRIVADHLQDIVKAQGIDLAIANAENSAGGFGVTPAIAEDLFGLGLDVLTSGNHIWDKREIYDYLGRTPRLLRPHNYPPGSPGSGCVIVKQCAILNLQGRTYMPNTDCPFRAADQLLAELAPAVKVRFVDFHAEVTSEKIAMGWYLDGRVSAVIGTHTHVPRTAERRQPSAGIRFRAIEMDDPASRDFTNKASRSGPWRQRRVRSPAKLAAPTSATWRRSLNQATRFAGGV